MSITVRPRQGNTNWASILIPGTRFWYIYIIYLLLVVTKFDWFYSNPVQTILGVIAWKKSLANRIQLYLLLFGGGRMFLKCCFFWVPKRKYWKHSHNSSSFCPMFRHALLLITVYHSLIEIFSSKHRINIPFTHVSVPRAMSDPLSWVVPHTTTSLAGASLDLPLFLGDEERRVWLLRSFHLSEGR